ncbi:MAG: sigma 54-interacting transcriptional regulator [Ignavibacteriaceae bacterium]|nr:sigma 54-interacting transcriptional regulator [Ignavibacteria bacterium]NNJ52113.1 sigma 54-interacting transcriptional regulator [Ignavibacteriaceae bacterium]NNL19796.1 sigma 54-interacting transcriptional regulator [Ignavibacteriaceae bacterium]
MNEDQENIDFFKVILSSIADGVFTVNSQRIITSFNRAAEKITGVPASQAVGKHCQDVFHSDICENCLLQDTLETGIEAIDRPVNIINNQGDKIPISISTAVLKSEEGKILGAVETFRDLSTIEHLRKELRRSYSLEDIISKSPRMHKLFAILPDIAESESTVLIQGPSGSGKELFARAIHNLSPRKNKNYVVINCGTLPVQLFESELFGYVKGAFTDAKTDKEGKLTKVNGGTVFFDEIGELPLSTQVKLLRLLQEREYEPLGSTETIKANLRVVAASNKDLKNLVAQAKFRDDLYFRLAVVKFDLPALKDRREDIPFLVDHFIRKFNAKTGKKIISVSPNVMNILMRYNFPGNIRELENIIEHGFVLCHGSIIKREHLSPELLPREQDSFTDIKSESTPVTESIDEQERIINAIQNCGGAVSKAAEQLGIHRTTLWRKIKRYNINIDQY